MRNVGRNLSMALNVVLLVALMAAAGWMWRASPGAQEEGDDADYRKISNTYEKYINSTLVAQRLVGRQFPKMERLDLTGRGRLH